MAIVQVQDGKIMENASTSALAKDTVKNKSTLDKDAFLGLLVAQMKYQDPLEPTSNTEFVSQYAQFSSLEQMQNMSSALELTRASSLVGQIVSVNTTNSLGKSVQLQGQVDYVYYENNKAFVSIGGTLYPLDDVYAVADQRYLDALDAANAFAEAMEKLPKKENLTLDDKETIDKLNKSYSEMSEYQKTFIASAYVKTLKEYTERIEELFKDKEENTVIGLHDSIGNLPSLETLTLTDKDKVEELNKIYGDLSDEGKKLVTEEDVKKLEEYVKRIKELEKE